MASVLGIALPLVACSPQRAIESAQTLGRLNSASVEYDVQPESVAFRPGVGVATGDLYWPEDAEAALVLVPGLVPQGKDDPRLVSLAQTLADARFAVLVPDLINLRAQKVSPDDARGIAAAITFLAHCSTAGAAPSVGVVAISYAAGPAILAAMRPDEASQVRFVVAIGGYYDLEAVVTFFTTGFYRTAPDQPWQHRTPNAYGRWVFVAANAERLDDPRDRAALATMATRKLRDLDADISELQDGLGDEGRAVMALLDNRDPERVGALIGELPASVRNDLAGLDLARQDLGRLQADLLLVHGRDDPIIPSTESEALAKAMPADQATIYVVDSLSHVELSPSSLVDGFRLWEAIYWLLTQRDASPRPDRSACR